MFSRDNIKIDVDHSESGVKIVASTNARCTSLLSGLEVTDELLDEQTELLKENIMYYFYGSLRDDLQRMMWKVHEVQGQFGIIYSNEPLGQLIIMISDALEKTRGGDHV